MVMISDVIIVEFFMKMHERFKMEVTEDIAEESSLVQSELRENSNFIISMFVVN